MTRINFRAVVFTSLLVETAVRNIGDKRAVILKHVIKNVYIYLGVIAQIQTLPSN
jgi:hypothetical protein